MECFPRDRINKVSIDKCLMRHPNVHVIHIHINLTKQENKTRHHTHSQINEEDINCSLLLITGPMVANAPIIKAVHPN